MPISESPPRFAPFSCAMKLASPVSSLLFLACTAALTFAADAPAKKRLLILGDSISIGYTPYVQKMLARNDRRCAP